MFRKLKRYLHDPKFALGCDLIQKHPNWMSDKFFLEVQGRLNMGYKLNLEMPHTFCEKINWLKLYERNPLYTVLVDKYRVKLWLQEHFGSDYIIPTLAVYETVDEINLIADSVINYERNCVTGISAALGTPGGVSMVATLPADIIQCFAIFGYGRNACNIVLGLQSLHNRL